MRASHALPVLASLLGGLLASDTRAQAPPDAAVRVDEIFAQWSSPTSPGCAVSVAEHGLTVMSRAWGMADLEHGIPNTPATIFRGWLGVEAVHGRGCRAAGAGRQAVAHGRRAYTRTRGAGLRNDHHAPSPHDAHEWTARLGKRRVRFAGWGRGNRSHRHAHVLDIVSRQSALNFPPGHEYSYSNTGYNLLADVRGPGERHAVRGILAEAHLRATRDDGHPVA